MILAGQTNSADQTAALQGQFAFKYKDGVATLDIFQLRIKVTDGDKCELYFLSPYKNGELPEPKLLLTLQDPAVELQDLDVRLRTLDDRVGVIEEHLLEEDEY